MQMRRRFQQTTTLEQRLLDEATRLRKQADGTRSGVEREQLLRRARRAETASHIDRWLSSKELRPPI
ncbi:hypothetical protein [Bradyrhizobium sp. Tv2a-2]|uniref:hypothetical protein n=1 Tax=Bradyrhizobium sp. Tv2a-2 TaxID=113395 RepID=UPI000407EC2C|nr:hypothetical protein [Bradyrhizobium sp. Tv2a-2]